VTGTSNIKTRQPTGMASEAAISGPGRGIGPDTGNIVSGQVHAPHETSHSGNGAPHPEQAIHHPFCLSIGLTSRSPDNSGPYPDFPGSLPNGYHPLTIDIYHSHLRTIGLLFCPETAAAGAAPAVVLNRISLSN
jgi:hypothetical protein